MAARTRRITLSEDWKDRIKVGEILARLNRHVNNKCKMSTTQIAAAKLLLSKLVPDLKSIEHSGSIEHHHVAEMTEDELVANISAARTELGDIGKPVRRTAKEKAEPNKPPVVH